MIGTWLVVSVLSVSLAPASAPTRLVATYSIVARDAATGELGVAVQSHWFSVGSVVPYAEAGVGAVATQSFVDSSYGPLGLDLMRAGKSAEEALAALLAADANREVRQVAMVDAKGRVAAHTGARCIVAAGRLDEARPLFADVFAREPRWRGLVPRLPAAGLLPDDQKVLAAIAAIADAKR
jgi:hypothetical protein